MPKKLCSRQKLPDLLLKKCKGGIPLVTVLTKLGWRNFNVKRSIPRYIADIVRDMKKKGLIAVESIDGSMEKCTIIPIQPVHQGIPLPVNSSSQGFATIESALENLLIAIKNHVESNQVEEKAVLTDRIKELEEANVKLLQDIEDLEDTKKENGLLKRIFNS